jgi:hypothetical protein
MRDYNVGNTTERDYLSTLSRLTTDSGIRIILNVLPQQFERHEYWYYFGLASNIKVSPQQFEWL